MRHFLCLFLVFSGLSLLASETDSYSKKLVKDLTEVLSSESPHVSLFRYVLDSQSELKSHEVINSDKPQKALEELVSFFVLPSSGFSKDFGFMPTWDREKKCYKSPNKLAYPLTELTGLRFYHPNGWLLVGSPKTIVDENPHYFNVERDTDHPEWDGEMWKSVPDVEYNLKNLMMRKFGDGKGDARCSFDLECLLSLEIPRSFVKLGFRGEDQVIKVLNTLGIKFCFQTKARVYKALREVFLEKEKEGDEGVIHILQRQLVNLFGNSLCP